MITNKEIMLQFAELEEQANELINCGNSKEIAEGVGMQRVLEVVKLFIEVNNIKKINPKAEIIEKITEIVKEVGSDSDDDSKIINAFDFSCGGSVLVKSCGEVNFQAENYYEGGVDVFCYDDNDDELSSEFERYEDLDIDVLKDILQTLQDYKENEC